MIHEMTSLVLPRLVTTVSYKSQEESFIKRLQYLESYKCRCEMSEELRIKERKEVTEEFKKFLIAKDFFKPSPKRNPDIYS